MSVFKGKQASSRREELMRWQEVQFQALWLSCI
uniref:Uncharacterized protein n=1 Tax=Arundo donax TaxID=35708 RepID=A0A0A9AG05_ARUDO